MEEHSRYKFLEVFQENTDGSLTPKKSISINGVTLGTGLSFQKGTVFGGVDFHLYKYWDIAGKEESGILNIVGFYKDEPVINNHT